VCHDSLVSQLVDYIIPVRWVYQRPDCTDFEVKSQSANS
jgi:hypothetical protein